MTAMPSQDMMAVAIRLAEFIARGGRDLPAGLFAREVTIVENFPPFVFGDPLRWAGAMRAHLLGTEDLACTFGTPQEFSTYANTVYFSLPTVWSGKNCGAAFSETGAWAMVLRYEDEAWRLAAYGWAVLETTTYPAA